MKKIVPKRDMSAAPSAEDLEASFQKMTVAVPKAVQVVAPSAPIAQNMPVSSQNTEGGYKAGKRTLTSKRDGRTRISIDIPDELFEQIEVNKEETGQTMTHLVVSLLKKFFAAKA